MGSNEKTLRGCSETSNQQTHSTCPLQQAMRSAKAWLATQVQEPSQTRVGQNSDMPWRKTRNRVHTNKRDKRKATIGISAWEEILSV